MSRTINITISLPGVLERAAEHCKKSRDWRTKTLEYDLLELLKHLEMVREDHSLVDRFFELYSKD
jgi:hypothetical protein